MTTFTDEQFKALLVTIIKPQSGSNDPAALGPMKPFVLGSNKMTRLKHFEDWLEDAESRMKYIGTQDDAAKVILLKSWGGSELVEFMRIHAKVVFDKKPASDSQEALEPDTYEQVIQKTTLEMKRLVNRTMAMHDLLNTQQGDRGWMDFIKDLENKAHILNFDSQPYKHKDIVKDAAIFGMTDKRLREKSLAEDPDLETLIRWGQARETGREGTSTLKQETLSGRVNQVANQRITSDMSDDELDDLMNTLQVMKLRKQGKYSARTPKEPPKGSCRNCSSAHLPGRCPANGKDCFTCGGKNHFSRAPACPKKVRFVENDTSSDEDTFAYGATATDTVNRVSRPQWPGVRSERTHHMRRLTSSINKIKEPSSKWVNVTLGDIRLRLFTDTGSDFTIIPPTMYDTSMGHVEAADTHLRAWGGKNNLDVKGMVRTVIKTDKGARKDTKIYIVDGFRPEPLLGDNDAQELGFIRFNKEGRDPLPHETSLSTVNRTTHCIPEKLRRGLGITVKTDRPSPQPVPEEEKKRVAELVQQYQGLVFNENAIGKLETPPIHLDYDPSYKPIQPKYRNTPIHYQKPVSDLLTFLRKEGVIKDVDPRKSYDCVMNTVITDKKNGSIRMNIDNTPLNAGMKRTKYHVPTPQEIRHDLKEATVFSEMDMGWGFHQLELDESSKEKAIFQTHEGLHRMERLYFGPTASTGIFHHEVRKAFTGVPGTISIHDNIIVWGRNFDEHHANLQACLQRCIEKNITLKMSKSTFCMNEIDWFGRQFTPHGVSADPKKIISIIEAGRPQTTEDVRSLLMACQYNVRFLFDHPNTSQSYEEITKPLRLLLKKGTKFHWQSSHEDAYNNLMSLMCSPATLRPFDINRTTHFVADSSEIGTQASIYQVDEENQWIPIDHISRALSESEQNYSPIERESLAQSWGMDQFRYYLVGNHFTSWSDHKPLLPIYNNYQKPASKRISKHRDNIQDLQYTMQHLPGDDMPCDFGSRHPNSINHLSDKDKERFGIDIGNEIYIRKLEICSSPDAVTVEDIKTTASNDPLYQELIALLQNGHHLPDHLSSYRKLRHELTIVDGLILKSHKIVVPDGEVFNGSGNIRQWIIDAAHDGHPGMNSMKRLLRSQIWFPGMDHAIEETVSRCHACQVSTVTKHRDPLIPTIAPSEAWQKLDADRWRPTPDGKFLLVVIDELTRYPEVAVVNNTGADANIAAFDEIFARHGFCKTLKTDNGPPFNGKEYHELQNYFKWAGIKHIPTRSADDPEANGLAESFMKHCTKVWHTATVEHKNPKAELNKHLRTFRATPHVTTGKSPAEALFGRKIRTRTPQLQAAPTADIIEILQRDAEVKNKQKKSKDKKAYVKPHNIHVGDQVLLSQRKTKSQPPHDPAPYTVTEIFGHQITATRDHQKKTRDAQKWKKINTKPPTNYNALRRKREEQAINNHDSEDDWLEFSTPSYKSTNNNMCDYNLTPDSDSEGNMNEEPPAARPQRNRRRPIRYGFENNNNS